MLSTLALGLATSQVLSSHMWCHIGHHSSRIYLLGQLILSAFWRGIIVLPRAVTCLGYAAIEEQNGARVQSSLP